MLDAVYTLLSEIWKSHLGSPELSDYALSENTEGRSFWCPYISMSHMGHMFQTGDHWKVARCVIANTRREVLVLVDFQDDYHSVNRLYTSQYT